MAQKDHKQYNVQSGPYKDKAAGLQFGYEYTSGNETENKKSKTKSTTIRKERP